MSDKLKIKWFYLLSGFFIVLNTILVIKEIYWGFAIPLAFVVIFLYLFRLDNLLLLIVFLVPLSVEIANSDLGFGISLPAEPMLVGVLLLFILKLLFDRNYDKRIYRHPVTLAVFFNLFWILITSLTSSMPVVSFKFLIARLWFVIPMFFVGVLLFKDIKNLERFQWAYVISLIIVIVYTTVRHAQYGFAEKQGHWVMKPFYNDHTAYGAILAFFLPVFIGAIFLRNRSRFYRYSAWIVSVVLLVALFLSYSRAAWISVAAALGVALLIVYKVKLRWILTGVGILIASFYMFKSEILFVLEKNKQDSSADFIEHVQSIYNISSDASNLERINRWQSAFRMFNERPAFGWGPGTYQFIYAPFQRSKERTIISTNAGDLGNAHSEYIGPLSEQGLPGLLSIVWIAIAAIYTGIRVYKRSNHPDVRIFSLVIVLSLITYFIHGFLNNFLDTDKASVPFWGFIAMLVALDIYHRKSQATDELSG